MRATRVIAIISIIGLAMAAKGSIKSKLAQTGAKALSEAVARDDPVDVVEDISQGAKCGQVVAPKPCGCTPLPFGWDLPDRIIPECTCEPGDLPLGATPGVNYLNSSITHLGATQDAIITAIPDTSFTGTEDHTCCSCENAVHDAYSNATKIRKFNINGDICVTETVCFAESSIAGEASLGSSHELFQHTETTTSGGLGATPDCHNLTVCPPEIVSFPHKD